MPLEPTMLCFIRGFMLRLTSLLFAAALQGQVFSPGPVWTPGTLATGDPLAIGMIADWSMLEGGGTMLEDTLGRSNAVLTAATVTPWVSGPAMSQGYAVNLTNAPYFSVGVRPWLDLERTDSCSFATWLYLANVTSNGTILGNQEATTFRGYRLSFTGATDKLRLQLVSIIDTSDLTVDGNLVLVANRWYHIAVTYDGTSAPAGVAFYIDGQLVPTTTITNTLITSIVSTANIEIGRSGSGTAQNLLNGRLSQLRIWKRTLSATEVRWLRSESLVMYSSSRHLWLNIVAAARRRNVIVAGAR